MGVFCILVHENSRIEARIKRKIVISCIIIYIASFAEWSVLMFNGNHSIPDWLFKVVKCVDFSMTPMCGVMIIPLLRSKNFASKLLITTLICNTLFQIVAVFTDWMVIIDEKHRYHNGVFYNVYIVFYILIILLVIAEFRIYGQQFRRQNRFSLYAILAMVGVGVAMQEITDGEVRSVYLALVIGVIMLYIHGIEFSSERVDDLVNAQKFQIMMNQIQPHFLFNCLSVIRETYYDDMQKGDESITQFANYLRHNMDAFNWNIVEFNEELKQVEGYVSLQKLRFGDKLEVKYELEVTDFKLPTLTLQPIVENAITYGRENKERRWGSSL